MVGSQKACWLWNGACEGVKGNKRGKKKGVRMDKNRGTRYDTSKPRENQPTFYKRYNRLLPYLVPARSTSDSTRESNHRRAERVGLKNY